MPPWSARRRDQLGRYVLLAPLGGGGGGEVWEALLEGPAGFRRRVAVKLLGDQHRKASRRDALLHEARLGGLVCHPNVVSTLELSCHEGRWFMVMELVRGPTAEHLCRLGPVPPAALLDLGRQVCAGLDHIHHLADDDGRPLGLVHRDIKPRNLLIGPHGIVQVADLGIARLTGEPGQAAGTPGYLPPEQLSGEEDARSDVFALGVTLCRMALGDYPLGRGTSALHLLDDVDYLVESAAISDRLDAYLPGLGPVIARAMRHHPSERWSDARALGAALDGLYGRCGDSQRLAAIVAGIPRGSPPSVPPAARRTFFGRERELGSLRKLLDAGPAVLVIKGPGGVGKTRLMDEATAGRSVRRCDATQAQTRTGLCHVVSQALGVPLEQQAEEGVAAALKDADVAWLVLDNVEQVAGPAASLVSTWREAAPQIGILLTSRVAVAVPESVEFRVGPMARSDAVDMLVAQYARPIGQPLAEALVQRVERLPLAVELTAAQARATSPDVVLDGLKSRGLEGLSESLRASWKLLPERGRQSLVLLSSFAGAFGLQDATAVLVGTALEALDELVDHSMLHVRSNAFRLLPSVRAFARAQSQEQVEVADRRHARWMARLGDEEQVASPGGEDAWFRHIDDLLAANAWAERADEPELAVATALALWRPLNRAGSLALLERRLTRARRHGLRVPEIQLQLARALYGQSHLERAEVALQDALSAGGVTHSHGLGLMALIRSSRGEPGAVELLEEAWVAQKMAGDPIYARTLGQLGEVLAYSGQHAEGERYLRDAIIACRMVGDVRYRKHLGQLATLQAMRGDFSAALEAMEELLAEPPHDDRVAATCLSNRAEILLILGQPDGAAASARRARAVVERRGAADLLRVAGCVVLADAARHLGRQEEALAELEEGNRLLADIEADSVRAKWLVARAALHEAVGAHADAVEALERALDLPGWVYVDVRARALFGLCRLAPIDTAIAAQHGWDEHGDIGPVGEAYLELARGWLAHRRQRDGPARASLLLCQQLADSMGLPDSAPLVVAHRVLKATLSGAA